MSESLQAKIFSRLFKVYERIMKHRDTPTWASGVLIAGMTLHLVCFFYDKRHGFPLDDRVYDNVVSFFDYIHIVPLLIGHPGGFLTFLFGTLFLILLYLGLLLYIDYSLSIHKFYFDFPISICRALSQFFYWLWLVPGMQIISNTFKCDGSSWEIYSGQKCYSGVHYIYCMFALICFLLFAGVTTLIALFFNESRASDHMDSLARLDVNLEIFLLYYRILLAIISIYVESRTFCWIFAAMHLIGSLNFLIHYFRYIPYYNDFISALYGSCICFYFWASLNSVLSLILDSIEYKVSNVSIILGILVIVPLISELRERCVMAKIYDYKIEHIAEEHELDIYIRQIIEMMNKKNSSEEVILLGFLYNHRNECRLPDCPISHTREIFLPKTGEVINTNQDLRNPVIILQLFSDTLRNYSKNSNSTATLHILYSQFLFNYIGNLHLSLIELYCAEKMEISIQQQFTIHRMKTQIEEFLIEKYKKKTKDSSKQIFENLDVTLVITFENMFAQLEKAIEKSASEHIEFWSHLDSLLPDMNRLHEIGLNIINYSRATQDIWNMLSKINPNYRKALHKYGKYLSEIRNDEEEGEEYISRSKLLEVSNNMEERMNDFEIMFADDTAIIVMSGNKETQGKITKTNAGISNVLEYNPAEVTGHDVSLLMPMMIGRHHTQFMEAYFNSGKEVMINKENELFAIPRSGSLISVSAIIKPVPSLVDNIQYISLLRERSRDFDFIITNEQGKIDAASKWISNMLQFPANFLKENEIFVQFLCPELLDIVLSPHRCLCTKMDLLDGVYDLTFIVPQNFLMIIQGLAKNPLGDEEENEPEVIEQEETTDLLDDQTIHRSGKLSKNTPAIVKKIGFMLTGQPVQDKMTVHRNLLSEGIKYSDYDFKHTWKVEVRNRSFGGGVVNLKVFKIMRDRNHEGTDQSSEMLYNVQKTQIGAEELEQFISAGLDMEPSSQYEKIEESKRETDLILEESKSVQPQVTESSQLLPTEKIIQDDELKKDSEAIPSNNSMSGEKEIFGEKNEPSLNEPGDKKNMPNEIVGTEQKHINPDVSMVSDLNFSRFEERPLIQEPHTVESPEKPRANSPIKKKLFQKKQKQEEFLSKSAVYGSQDDVIRNYIKSGFPQEEASAEKKQETKKEEKQQQIDDDSGSVASNTKSLLKHLRALRKAVYEQYCPSSIVQLQYVARIVFFSLMVITIVYFFVSINLYSNLDQQSEIISYSKQRFASVLGVGTACRALTLMNSKARSPEYALIDTSSRTSSYYYYDLDNEIEVLTTDFKVWSYKRLEYFAIILKKAQNSISTTGLSFEKNHLELINPSQILVYYQNDTDIAADFYVDCWSAIMSLVTHSLKVKDLSLEDVTENEASVLFVLKNSFNSILGSIKQSTEAILEEISDSASFNRTIFLVLLLVASVALSVSVAIIIRVVIKASQSKEDILVLFTEIPSSSIKHQLSRCRRCINVFRDEEKAGQQEEIEIVEEEEEKKENETLDDQKEDEEEDDLLKAERKDKRKRKVKKKFKPYSTNIMILLLEFCFFVILLEGYFLLSYFKSDHFLSKALDLITEVGALTNRSNNNNLIFSIVQEYIGTNATATILNINSGKFAIQTINDTIKNQENFLQIHSDNKGSASDEYNDYFEKIIYDNVCELLYSNSETLKSQCSEFQVLEKGLHSGNVAFWDNLRHITYEFYQKETNITNAYILSLLNDTIIIDNELLYSRYFTAAYDALSNKLQENIDNEFASENQFVICLFVCYLMLLVVLYFFIWSSFLESTRQSLWVTKSMLAIIPVNTIQEVRSIKNFLIQTSQTLFIGIRSD